jgi:hypothetical protein
MSAGIKKAAKGRTMRVAIAFTGAAACTAALTPAATAATTTPTGTAAHTGIRPDIKPGNCATDPRWVHLVSSQSHSYCYGFYGWSDIYMPMYYMCGGNNSGRLYTTSGHSTRFRAGDTYVLLPFSGATIRSIYISNDNPTGGKDACQQFNVAKRPRA